MLRACSQFLRRASQRSLHYSTNWATRSNSIGTLRLFPTLQTLDEENSRLLAVIDKHIDERHSLSLQASNSDSGIVDVELCKRLKNLDEFYKTWCIWQETRKHLSETALLLRDEDQTIRDLAEEEYEKLLDYHNTLLYEKIPALLVPRSIATDVSALIELKPGVGGSESSLFLSDLLRMYTRYANLRRWTAKIISSDNKDGGGLKYAILEIGGEGAYECLQWENGVHRVQRIPKTEASGRVHTSTVQVLVLPVPKENSDVNEEDDVLDEKDVRIEVMRARGAGGQHVNKTESAVRLTHLPTGITVSMQDERSQHMNKSRAFKVLRARLLDRKLQTEVTERRETRRKLVKSADRSEKIRTYNFAQDRVTDHRIGMTVKNIPSVLEGDTLQDILDAIQKSHRQELIEEMLENV
ncbi:release factor [Sanghuangporus baumii]|uniref:Release factor n=1 Tax=Sanghuangporus baumii TaxID=108892 RepID=A0A9Q5N4U1_SANBA|nr:release factor [Sanghuangporus baumii]